MNGTERRYAELLEQRRVAGEVLWWKFESIAFRLAEERCFYHPDFMVMLADLTIEIHEVKGGFIRDDGRDKLKVAAALFPFVFRRCVWKDAKWTITEVGRALKTEHGSRKSPDNETTSPEITDNGIRSAEPRPEVAKIRNLATATPQRRQYTGGPLGPDEAIVDGHIVSKAEALAEVQRHFGKRAS